MEIVIYVAHVDDETIFAGGSIAKWIEQGHIVHIVYTNNGVIVHGRSGHDYRPHAKTIAESYGVKSYHFLNIPTMEFDKYGQLELNKRFDKLKLNYDIIVTHHSNDVNIDHQIVYQSARVLSRYNSVNLLCCDSIGSFFDFNPNFYVDISDTINTKFKIMKIIDVEMHKYPHERSYLAIKAKNMYRGSQIKCRFAEAFEVKKWIV